MKVLVSSLTPPLPATSGQRMRFWALLRAFAAEGHELHLFTFAQPHELSAVTLPELKRVCREVRSLPLEAHKLSSRADYLARAANVLSPLPYGVSRFSMPEMRRLLAGAATSGGYAAVLALSPYCLVNVPEDIGLPLLVDDQNIEHMIIKRYVALERNPVRKGYAWLEFRKMREWEAAQCARGRVVMVCSQVDRAAMQQMCPGVPVTYVPNIIDIETYAAVVSDEPGCLLYVGGMDWLPNRDAVEFFARAVLPELRTMVSPVKFAVAYTADHAPSSEIRARLADVPELEFVETGDIRGEIARASVFVVPLRIGSGTRFKILEAAATAKPIVSTSIGAEGLTFEDGKEILLRDDPRSFAAAVADLLRDQIARRAMGLSARRKVEREHGFPALRSTLREALALFTGESASRGTVQEQAV